MQFNVGDRVYIGKLVRYTSDTNHHETLRLLKDEFGKITKIYTNKLYKIEIGETNIVVTEEWLIKKQEDYIRSISQRTINMSDIKSLTYEDFCRYAVRDEVKLYRFIKSRQISSVELYSGEEINVIGKYFYAYNKRNNKWMTDYEDRLCAQILDEWLVKNKFCINDVEFFMVDPNEVL